jgi:choline-glycine betaine transporter
MGDVLDGMAIVSALVGSCLIMTFSIVQLVVCFMYLEWMDTDSTKEDIAMMQNVTIWVITILSTASVISGLRGGVRFFSRTALAFCTLLLLLVLIMDDTKFLLNLQVQEVGYHLQTSIFQLSFWTDAFGQLRPGEGRAIDSKASDPLWYNSIIGASHAASYVQWTWTVSRRK